MGQAGSLVSLVERYTGALFLGVEGREREVRSGNRKLGGAVGGSSLSRAARCSMPVHVPVVVVVVARGSVQFGVGEGNLLRNAALRYPWFGIAGFAVVVTLAVSVMDASRTGYFVVEPS